MENEMSEKSVSESYKVKVDYGVPLADMVKAGSYDMVFKGISDGDFPIRGVGEHEVELVLVHLNREAKTSEVRKHLESLGLLSAGIEHLLAFGATYPEVQRQFPIIALGTVHQEIFCPTDIHVPPQLGKRVENYVPYLDVDGGKRWLYANRIDGNNDWFETCRFLALHNNEGN